MQVKGISYQDFSLASPEDSPKGTPKDTSDEEKQMPESGGSIDTNHETSFATVPAEQPIMDEASGDTPNIGNETSSETNAEGEDGWQSVQRPRSAGSYGRRIRQRRASISKVYAYQKKDVDTELDYNQVKNTYQNSRYYMVKRCTISAGSTDYHVTSSSPGTKFGRRIVKAVTYRVKSVPSAKTGTKLEAGTISAPNDTSPVSQSKSVVSLGKSLSYKEVALAPPGTIAKLQVTVFQNDIPDNQQPDVRELEVETNEPSESMDLMITEAANINAEEKKISISDSKDDLKDEVEVIDKKEETQSGDAIRDIPSEIVSESVEAVEPCGAEVQELVQGDVKMDGGPNSTDPPYKELPEDSSSSERNENSISTLQGVENLKDKLSVLNSGDTRELPNKKLSASAAPFNPSPAVSRSPPVAMNITLPSGPGAVSAVSAWPLNMTLHPGSATVLPAVNPMCSSPHHPYPSPPPTPNMMHPLTFLYPSYTQPQAIPTSNFPVTSSPFHPNHFAWQCNMNPNASEFMSGTVWPGCHPMEFSIIPPVIEPISDPILEPKVQSGNSEVPTSSPIPPEDISNGGETIKEVNILESEAMGNANTIPVVGTENGKEIAHPDPCTVESSGKEQLGHSNSPNEYNGTSNERKIDGEKTFSILIRGRRNRKQTLRMPISLLNRPYGSQSFKVIYNRVVRGSDVPKSNCNSLREESTAGAV